VNSFRERKLFRVATEVRSIKAGLAISVESQAFFLRRRPKCPSLRGIHRRSIPAAMLRPRTLSNRLMSLDSQPRTFYGWRVVVAAFVLAVFGWGVGFYGPPIFLHAVREARGWPVSLVSTAVTAHFLVG